MKNSKGLILQVDDLEVGQLVTVHSFRTKRFRPSPFFGQAAKISAVNLPFIVVVPVATPEESVVLDLRVMRLMKITREYAKAQIQDNMARLNNMFE